MKAVARLAVFASIAAAAFGAAFAAGAVTDPIISPAAPAHERAHQPAATQAATRAAGMPGLGMSERGYTVRVADSTLPRGDQVLVSFRIDGPGGVPVKQFRATYEKEMHLILVRRDLSSFQHLHPTRDSGGIWTTTVDLSVAGTYRLLADFASAELGGPMLALGTDLFVPGPFEGVELPPPTTLSAAEGYEVTVAGGPRAGEECTLEFAVRRGGAPVIDLEPYLAASGHLVALRYGDLAYLHTHPVAGPTPPQIIGPPMRFAVTFPTPGLYRLFLNFAHAGQVRTAAFTIDVGPAHASPGQPPVPHVPAYAPDSAAGDQARGHAGH